jgi:hypothetical protein
MPTLKRCEEVEQRVEFDYEPPQEQTRTDPSYPSQVTINSVTVFGVEILPAMSRSKIDALEELCLGDVEQAPIEE